MLLYPGKSKKAKEHRRQDTNWHPWLTTKKREPLGSRVLRHDVIICHGHIPIFRKDQVVQYRDIQEGSGLLDFLGDLQVSFRRLQIAGGMVVSKYDTGSVGFDGNLVDDAYIGDRPAKTAL